MNPLDLAAHALAKMTKEERVALAQEVQRDHEDAFDDIDANDFGLYLPLSKARTRDELAIAHIPAYRDPLTCDDCGVVDCEYRGDGYNTNGDCLADKQEDEMTETIRTCGECVHYDDGCTPLQECTADTQACEDFLLAPDPPAEPETHVEPCNFCGGAVVWYPRRWHDGSGEWQTVCECAACGEDCDTTWPGESDALKDWNRAQVRLRLERRREVMLAALQGAAYSLSAWDAEDATRDEKAHDVIFSAKAIADAMESVR